MCKEENILLYLFNKIKNKLNNIKTVFTIKDLENISGIKAHTIRIWEKRYSLLEPNRTETNIRYYSTESMLKLLNVVLLNKNDYKISKIAKMSAEEILSNARQVAYSNAVEDDAINTFKMAMFQFDKSLFNATYNKLLHQKTFQQIFKEVFVPFLDEIGMLWHTKTIMPAHEHFISNLIIQKIQLNIENLEQNIIEGSTTYVLFLPDGEIHEIGLMYLNYELALKGHQTIYLGQSLPLDNLNYFFDSEAKVCFITSITVKPYDSDIKSYFKNIDKILTGTEHSLIAIGRRLNLVEDLKFKSQITLYQTVIECIEKHKKVLEFDK